MDVNSVSSTLSEMKKRKRGEIAPGYGAWSTKNRVHYNQAQGTTKRMQKSFMALGLQEEMHFHSLISWLAFLFTSTSKFVPSVLNI